MVQNHSSSLSKNTTMSLLEFAFPSVFVKGASPLEVGYEAHFTLHSLLILFRCTMGHVGALLPLHMTSQMALSRAGGKSTQSNQEVTTVLTETFFKHPTGKFYERFYWGKKKKK